VAHRFVEPFNVTGGSCGWQREGGGAAEWEKYAFHSAGETSQGTGYFVGSAGAPEAVLGLR
jgi:hypothetical protein